MQHQIKAARPDLTTYTAGQTLYVFAKGQEITFKCVPINAEPNLWLCSTQNRNTVMIKDLGRLTPENVLQKINEIFPKPI